MNNTLKIVLGVVVLGVITYLGMSYPKSVTSVISLGSNSGTNTDAKQVEAVAWDLSTGTSTSVLIPSNMTASQFQLSCTGVGTSQTAYTGTGLASVTIKLATTSTSYSSNTPTSNTLVSNTNLAVSTTLATSSAITTIASTTQAVGGASGVSQLLLGGSYATFFTNATNTAVCNIGVQAF